MTFRLSQHFASPKVGLVPHRDGHHFFDSVKLEM